MTRPAHRTLLAEDERLSRDRLARLLRARSDLEVVAGRTRFVRFDRIAVVSASLKDIAIETVEGERHTVAMSLRAAEARLPGPPFMRISRSAIVNLDYVQEMHELPVDRAEMLVRSGRRVSVSRRYRRQLKHLLSG